MLARRKAFTLIEMLVVMVIVVAIAAMVLLFWPRWEQNQFARQSAPLVQDALVKAKRIACATARPTGVRIYLDANNQANELVYVQQIDDLYGGTTKTKAMPGGRSVTWFDGGQVLGPDPLNQPNGLILQFSAYPGDPQTNDPPADASVMLTNGQTDPAYWWILVGDILEIDGGGLMKRITSVGAPVPAGPPTAPNSVVNVPIAVTMLGTSPVPTKEFRVIRGNRILSGEAHVKLIGNAVIDTVPNTTYSNPLPMFSSRTIEIIFAPEGNVLTPLRGGTFLFVRNPTFDNWWDGNPVCVTIKFQNGRIGTVEYSKDGTGPDVQAANDRSGY